MKLLFSLLTIIAGFTALPAFGNQLHIICEEDRRPTDGDYAKLEVQFIAENRANITVSHIGGGFTPFPQEQAKKGKLVVTELGRNMFCKQAAVRAISLSCYQNGASKPSLVLQQKSYYGQDFVELFKDGQTQGLFELSSCRYSRAGAQRGLF